jgi:hypothetical protein
MRRKTLIQTSARCNKFYPDDRIDAHHFYWRYPYKRDKVTVRTYGKHQDESEYGLSYGQWKQALFAYFTAIYEELAEGRDYQFPIKQLGKIQMRKYRVGINRTWKLQNKKQNIYRYRYFVQWVDKKFKFNSYWSSRFSKKYMRHANSIIKDNIGNIYKILDVAGTKASWSYEDRQADLKTKPRKCRR